MVQYNTKKFRKCLKGIKVNYRHYQILLCQHNNNRHKVSQVMIANFNHVINQMYNFSSLNHPNLQWVNIDNLRDNYKFILHQKIKRGQEIKSFLRASLKINNNKKRKSNYKVKNQYIKKMELFLFIITYHLKNKKKLTE